MSTASQWRCCYKLLRGDGYRFVFHVFLPLPLSFHFCRIPFICLFVDNQSAGGGLIVGWLVINTQNPLFTNAYTRPFFRLTEKATDIDMEGEKRADSSSFTSDLFGSKDPSSASSASASSILASIFPPNSPKVSGTESLRSEAVDKKQDCTSKAWNAKLGPSVGIPQSKEGESQSLSNEDMSSFYNEQKVQPCPLSSSIYYGGQDHYSSPRNTKSSECSTFNKDGGEDDSGSDSRGNWWQGGVYY